MHWVYSKSRDTIPLNRYNTMYICKTFITIVHIIFTTMLKYLHTVQCTVLYNV